MKHFTNICCLWALLFIALPGTSPAAAQEWSAAQKEVLASMEAYAAAWEGGNQEEIVSYLHPDFHSWNFEEDFPRSRPSGEKKIELFLRKYDLISMELRPLAIQVFGDAAVVHLYFEEIMRDSTGTHTNSSGRWTVSLLKENGKWVFTSFAWISTALVHDWPRH
ncbi:nuclear transport factor 2 family protein [Acidobacteria bacterium AH-259-G07]|nr:nuclear transport factor 2 family protein [Acidobacteria bacterium AH-259-G07]